MPWSALACVQACAHASIRVNPRVDPQQLCGYHALVMYYLYAPLAAAGGPGLPPIWFAVSSGEMHRIASGCTPVPKRHLSRSFVHSHVCMYVCVCMATDAQTSQVTHNDSTCRSCSFFFCRSACPACKTHEHHHTHMGGITVPNKISYANPSTVRTRPYVTHMYVAQPPAP